MSRSRDTALLASSAVKSFWWVMPALRASEDTALVRRRHVTCARRTACQDIRAGGQAMCRHVHPSFCYRNIGMWA